MAAHGEELLQRFQAHPCHLERLYGVVTDLYIDRAKAKVGASVWGKPQAQGPMHGIEMGSKMGDWFDQLGGCDLGLGQGMNGRPKIPQVIEALNNYNFERLVDLFSDV